MNMSDEDVQQKLRDLFSDERLGVRSTLNPEAIVAGARRRRRRRHLMQTTTGVAAAVVMVGSGLTVFSIHDGDNGAIISADQLSMGASASSGMPGPGVPPSAAPPSGPPSSQAQDVPTSTAGGGPVKPPKTTPATKPPSPGKVTTGPVLTASGFGRLQLGMSEVEAEAAVGPLRAKEVRGDCTYGYAEGPGVPAPTAVSLTEAQGVTVINPANTVHTPEGVGVGSTEDDILAAYPGSSKESGYYTSPAGGVSEYRIFVSNDGVAVSIVLTRVDQSCSMS